MEADAIASGAPHTLRSGTRLRDAPQAGNGDARVGAAHDIH